MTNFQKRLASMVLIVGNGIFPVHHDEYIIVLVTDEYIIVLVIDEYLIL